MCAARVQRTRTWTGPAPRKKKALFVSRCAAQARAHRLTSWRKIGAQLGHVSQFPPRPRKAAAACVYCKSWYQLRLQKEVRNEKTNTRRFAQGREHLPVGRPGSGALARVGARGPGACRRRRCGPDPPPGPLSPEGRLRLRPRPIPPSIRRRRDPFPTEPPRPLRKNRRSRSIMRLPWKLRRPIRRPQPICRPPTRRPPRAGSNRAPASG